MITQTGDNPQSGITYWKWLLVGGCAIVLLLLVGCVAAYFFLLRGGGGEPATASVVERVTKDFATALQSGDVEAAYQMSSEVIRPGISKDKYSLLLETDKDWAVFKTYQSLEVCDWGFFATTNGNIISAQGLFHYKEGDIVFTSKLRKDSDTIWRIYEFRLMPDVDPKPFGHCIKQ